MEIKKFVMGELESNSYLVIDGREAVLFDVGSEKILEIKQYIEENNLNLRKIIFTHGHIDHIKGLDKIVDEYNDIEIYIGLEDKEFLDNPALNLSKFVYFKEISFHYNEKVKTLNEGDKIFGFEVMSTPGHTIGSKVFFNREEKWLITGDTLFKGSMGRTDFPTGDFSTLMASLNKLLLAYPGETLVFSGHGEETTIRNEQYNFDI